MTAVAVAAGKAAPGATTVAAALTLSWPGPVLLVDADPAGGDVVPGLLPGRAGAHTSVLSWTVATRHLPALEATAALVEHVLVLPEAGDAWLLPGLATGGQAAALTGAGAARLAGAVQRCPAVLGRDVLVDVGRLAEASCWPAVTACDVVLLVVRPTARSVQATRGAVQLLRAHLGDLDAVRLVVTGAGPYPSGRVAEAVGVELAATVPADPRAAGCLVDGSAATVRGLSRTRLVRAAGQLAGRLAVPAPARAGAW